MVTLVEKVYVIGGLLNDNVPGTPLYKIYELDKEMTKWREMKQHLSVSRYYMTALAIPDTMTSCRKIKQ